MILFFKEIFLKISVPFIKKFEYASPEWMSSVEMVLFKLIDLKRTFYSSRNTGSTGVE